MTARRIVPGPGRRKVAVLFRSPSFREALHSGICDRRVGRRDQLSLSTAFADMGKPLQLSCGNFCKPWGVIVRKAVIAGWLIEVVGLVLWTYGYFIVGNPSVINWAAHTPWWIADLPKLESEIGMVLVFVGMVPIYWPPRS